MKKIKFTDITLRETAAGRGSSLSFKEAIEMAKILDKLGVDVIGLAPIANVKVDSLLVRTIASAVRKSVLSIPTGYTDESVEDAWNAVSASQNKRLCVEVPVSAVQMEFLCHRKPEAVIELIGQLVTKARSCCPDVEYAALDATRCDLEFLAKAVKTAVAAGAATVTLCDSSGSMFPAEFGKFITDLRALAPELKNVSLAVRCSDELSMSPACSLAAVEQGAAEIDVCVHDGAALKLETAAQIIRTRGDDLSVKCGLKFTELHRAVKQMNWLSHTEEPKSAPFDTVVSTGPARELKLDAKDSVATVSKAVKKLGYDLSEEDLAKVYEAFQNVAEKKSVGTKELEAIVASAAMQVPPTYKLVSHVINSGNIIRSTANIHVQKDGKDLFGLAVGDGPVDAAFLAIENITGRHYELDEFQIQAVTEGREALGAAFIKLRSNGRLYSGNGLSTDILGSCIRAYVNALNKIAYEEVHAQ